ATHFPSGLMAISSRLPSSPSNLTSVGSCASCKALQILTDPSQPPETIRVPSALIATHPTPDWCPRIVASNFPVSGFQTLTVLSPPADRSCLPSGLNATP